MVMDDPWGSSPWADNSDRQAGPLTAKDDAEGSDARPNFPVKVSNLGLEVKGNSPWNDDDDGFGDWEAPEDVKGNVLPLGGAGDTWALHKTSDSTKKNDGFDGLSWNDDMPLHDETNLKITPDLMPNAAAILRQPLPDPWATETALNKGVDVEYRQEVGTDEGNRENEHFESISESSRERNATPQTLPAPVEMTSGSLKLSGKELEQSGADEQSRESKPSEAVEEVVNAHDIGHESSRPSSSPSDQSHRDEILPDSPRTSLDEEPKRPEAPRKVSSKIQQLVEHFDGLARQEEEIVVEQSRGQSGLESPSIREEVSIEKDEVPVKEDHKQAQEEEDGDFGDFGEFEEGQSEADEEMDEQLKRPVTPTPSHSQSTLSPMSKITSPQISPPRSHHVMKDYGRVTFAIDTPILEKFFAESGEVTRKDATAEKLFITDVIPHDSFQSLEERKTWYRVSRYGTMRKHNSGDDENYIRITWPLSKVREQTLKTVARWMEEDRLSGHVILGGGSKGSSAFGWNDANAPTVPLASAFSAKQQKTTPGNPNVEATSEIPREWPKGLIKDPSASKSHSSPKAKRSSTTTDNLQENPKSKPQAQVANFEWSASPAAGSQAAIPLAKEAPKGFLEDKIQASLSHQSTSPGSCQNGFSITTPVRPVHNNSTPGFMGPPLAPTSNLTPGEESLTLSPRSNDDYNDWGEMMASPVASTTPAPTLPPLKQLRHKKSQSLSEAFSQPRNPTSIEAPMSPQAARSHKSSMSFNNILIPQPRSSVDSKSDPFPSSTSLVSASSFSSAPQLSHSTVTSTSNQDPWASADFSFFESTEPAPSQVSAATPKPNLNVASFGTIPATPSLLQHGKTRQEAEQDEIVVNIVKSLPDLSYMLRR